MSLSHEAQHTKDNAHQIETKIFRSVSESMNTGKTSALLEYGLCPILTAFLGSKAQGSVTAAVHRMKREGSQIN